MEGRTLSRRNCVKRRKKSWVLTSSALLVTPRPMSFVVPKGSILLRQEGVNVCSLPHQEQYPRLCSALSAAADTFIPPPEQSILPAFGFAWTAPEANVVSKAGGPIRRFVLKHVVQTAWVQRQIDKLAVQALTHQNHWFYKRFFVEDMSRETIERILRMLEQMAPGWSDLTQVHSALDGLQQVATTQEARFACTNATKPLSRAFGTLKNLLKDVVNGYKIPALKIQFKTPWAALRAALDSFPQ